MNPMRRGSKKGFTLVELMVVAVIVAILAAVAIPLMSANKKRAMSTEAEAALGTIRTALRSLYAQTTAYDKDLGGTAIATVTGIPGIEAGDLEGRYWKETMYSVTLTPTTYTITATGSGTDLAGIVITLDHTGKFSYTGL